MKKLIQNYFKKHQEVIKEININDIVNISRTIKKSFKKNKNIFVCGNGGSAYNASHFITDWNKMVMVHKGEKFKGYSLCDNLGILTAYANDFEYKKVFSGQLRSIYNKGDLLIAISGSGNSANIIDAVKFVKKYNGQVISLTGFDGGKLKKISNYNVHIPSFDMQICEDMHLMIGHIIMKYLCDDTVR